MPQDFKLITHLTNAFAPLPKAAIEIALVGEPTRERHDLARDQANHEEDEADQQAAASAPQLGVEASHFSLFTPGEVVVDRLDDV